MKSLEDGFSGLFFLHMILLAVGSVIGLAIVLYRDHYTPQDDFYVSLALGTISSLVLGVVVAGAASILWVFITVALIRTMNWLFHEDFLSSAIGLCMMAVGAVGFTYWYLANFKAVRILLY